MAISSVPLIPYVPIIIASSNKYHGNSSFICDATCGITGEIIGYSLACVGVLLLIIILFIQLRHNMRYGS